MLGNFLQMLYNLADSYFLGKIGKEAISAPSISMNLIFFLIIFAFGFSSAGTTLISQSMGKGDKRKTDFYLGQMTVLLLVVASIISILGIIFTDNILHLMQVPDDTFQYTSDYLKIILAGIPFMFMSFILRSALQGVGNSITPLVVQSVTVFLNILLDPIFIFGFGPVPAMSVRGAAYATVIARMVASIIAVVILVKGSKGIKLHYKDMIPDKKAIKLLLKIGLPSSVGQGISAFGFTVLQGVVNGFGTAVIAAFGIGNRIIGLFNMPAMGISQATAVLVGQQLGAKNYNNVKKIVKHSFITIFIFISVGMTITFFRGNLVVRFFVDDLDVIYHGAMLFKIVSPSVIFFALFTVANGAFQGAGDTKPIMALNIIRLWGIRVPLVFLLVAFTGLGPVSIWIGMFASNLVVAIAGFYLLSQGNWMHKLNSDEI
ncbi:MAG: MATE family efflux transporter [Spirochaetia bacterium]|jgi:putative MATE family efflux protein|nr:MATE family efflux transporter [Spirochaetia bacterium]